MNLNKNNLLLYAAKNYNNPCCTSIDEFTDDIKRFLYLKKLFKKYKSDNTLKQQLISNHIIILFNVFGIIPTYYLLSFHVLPEHYSILKTFLVYLNLYRDDCDKYNLDLRNILLDENIVKVLREYK